MITFVLSSGGYSKYPEKKKQLHRELVKNLGDSPRFLICPFAQPRGRWEEGFEVYSSDIQNDMPESVKPTFELAMPESFDEQCKRSDIIYLWGGDDTLVLHYLKQYDLATIWQNKIVATNSASSHAVAESFWTCDWRACMDGFGLLPIKFLAHFNSEYGATDPRGPIDWEAGKTALQRYGNPDTKIYAVPEGEFVILTRD